MRFLSFIILVSFLSVGSVRAEWVSARGEYSFGPETSEQVACQRAERRAKENALKTLQGERLSSDDLLICKEQGSKAGCDLNRFTWSTINGLISGLRDVKRETKVHSSSFRTCEVSLMANVETAKGQVDPNFDLAVQLNEKVFKSGDIMSLLLEPTKPMYISVFQWLPYERSADQVMQIFPNVMDRDNRFIGAGTVPTQRGKENYDFEVRFPENHASNERMVDEYLLVLATKDNVSLRETYTIEEFNKRLLEIPRDQSRLIKRAYMVVKP